MPYPGDGFETTVRKIARGPAPSVSAGRRFSFGRARTVGILDLLTLLVAWGTDPGGPPDFNGDGTVGILDLLTLLANWGPCA